MRAIHLALTLRSAMPNASLGYAKRFARLRQTLRYASGSLRYTSFDLALDLADDVFLCPSCGQKRTLLLGEYLADDLLLRLPHRQFGANEVRDGRFQRRCADSLRGIDRCSLALGS